ncbi:hypothetical protein K469DRAFT_639041 [Zopfia rhizophila CBS 207.26]|uniref:Uncharacterized protein n=1 Tax=Zopfia rhizophila CBS 207.26 TaxID=1314779 RepID=A0A6A6DSQ8_9PEZI|nr:hypothetical protein K469DRAFT_639041 [Zopfia rhizophila CBS 207.26]
MEAAYLTQAHEHVRNAATATYSSNIAAAGAEHELAASAFRDAAQDTHNVEALRILGLLEGHHQQLAKVIKDPPSRKEKNSDQASQAPESTTISPPSRTLSVRAASPSPSTSPPTRAPSRRRLPHSSIASNLAEKRGIPSARRGTPAASAVSVANALAIRSDRQPETPVQDLLQRQSREPEEADKKKEEPPRPSQRSEKEDASTTRSSSPPSDDKFRAFYTQFGNIISHISPSLAFTSLPLNPTSNTTSNASPEPTSPSKRSKSKSPESSRALTPSEPDITTLISKPALQALKEDQGPSGPFANTESFYVVPTSGGTVSYSTIHNHSHPHHLAQGPHLPDVAEEEASGDAGLRGSSHEEFVDARETAYPPSPTTPRHARPRSKGSVASARSIPAGRGTGLKTMEELQLENDTLRGLLDKQSKRLQMWEATSQSSYNALAQSFRVRGGLKQQLSDPSALAQALSIGTNAIPALPSPPPVPSIPEQYKQASSPSKASGDQAAKEQVARIAELEALLANRDTQLADLEQQNEKNVKVIRRYREQWEKLKSGARERRERRIAELKAEGEVGKDSESGDKEGEDEGVEEPGFGKT